MTRLEERLRAELPDLADALTEHDGSPVASASIVPIDVDLAPRGGGRHVLRRRVLAGALAAVVVGTTAAIAVRSDVFRSSDADQGSGAAMVKVPTGFGTWAPMADGPIEPRPYAVTGWTGSKVVFWAGSSLSRGFAYSDGAIYDPASDAWESMAVPGWGHPGLTSAFFDGELYALAKGGGTRFDPIAGAWRDLPPVDGMFLAATVATDDGIWGLGPAGLNPAGQPDLAIARYHPDDDRWIYGPIWEATDEQSTIVAGLTALESTAMWTGEEIAACGRIGGCVAFDPVGESWRSIPPAHAADGPGIAVATDVGLAMIGPMATGADMVAVDVLTDDGWDQRVTGIPVGRFDTATVAAAGEWIVVFASGQPPAVVHLPSGTLHVDTEAPIGGVQAPNVVWTGAELVVWGGVPDDPSAVHGAIWAPPRPG